MKWQCRKNSFKKTMYWIYLYTNLFLKIYYYSSSYFVFLLTADLMSIIKWKFHIFSISKELYESLLIFPKSWLILTAITFFFTYKIFNLITNFNNPWLNNTKYLNSPPQTLINPSNLSNLICNGIGPAEGLSETS